MHDYLQRKKEKEQQNQHLLYLEKEKQTLYDLPLSANTGKLGLEEDIYVYTHKTNSCRLLLLKNGKTYYNYTSPLLHIAVLKMGYIFPFLLTKL